MLHLCFESLCCICVSKTSDASVFQKLLCCICVSKAYVASLFQKLMLHLCFRSLCCICVSKAYVASVFQKLTLHLCFRSLRMLHLCFKSLCFICDSKAAVCCICVSKACVASMFQKLTYAAGMEEDTIWRPGVRMLRVSRRRRWRRGWTSTRRTPTPPRGRRSCSPSLPRWLSPRYVD